MTRFQPILLGSDINVYGMARAFHEEYGLVSEAYAYFQLSPTKFSRIVNVHIVDDFNNFVTFRNFMLKLGKRMKAEDPERVLLLIPCGDVYANLLSQCGDDLREYFVYNTLDVNLSRRLAYKSTFYQICEQYDLPHPKTRTVTADEVKAGEYIKNEWEGKREGRSWQQVMTNLELSKKYQEKDAAGYSATLEKAGKVFQKNPLFMAKNLMLKGEDEAAVRLLENDTEKLPYYEVTRRFLLGVCYYRIGKEEQGKECMEYVIGHGNTLKCKEEAEKYVTV